MELTRGERAADAVASLMGSWKFVIAQAAVMVCWFALNASAWILAWDPYPFILLNLAMSAEAAFATPLLLMSNNRQAARDRATLEDDHRLDAEALELTKKIADHIGVPRD